MQIKPNAYSLATRNLNHQGFACFMPLTKETRRQGTKFKNVSRALFSGYLFVSFDIQRSGWQKINSTLGVTRLVSQQGLPQMVPHKFIEVLKARLDQNGFLMSPDCFQAGDLVTVNTGPFAGFFAEVERLPADARSLALLNLIGLKGQFVTNTQNIRKYREGA